MRGVGQNVQRLRITFNGRSYDVTVEDLDAPAPAPASPAVAAPVAAASVPPIPAAGGGEVRSPMPGVVSAVSVRVGQAVAAGDVLLVLEAMKMDNEIPAPAAGTVREIRVARGDQVAAQQVLLVLG